MSQFDIRPTLYRLLDVIMLVGVNWEYESKRGSAAGFLINLDLHLIVD